MDAVIQFLKVVVIILVVGFIMSVAGLIGVFVSDTLFGPKPVQASNITYNAADGTPLIAYLNIPQVPGRPYPGIIMAPDRWGLDGAMIKLANLLADQGYAVIVPDLYRGTSSGALPRALFLTLTTPVDRVMGDMQSTFEYLARQNGVNPAHMGVMGLGYGGSMALRYAAQNPDVAAVVDAYGSPLADAALLSQIHGPVQGIFGKSDLFVPARQVEQFRAALETTDVTYDIQVYNEFGDGFFAYPDIGFPSTAVRKIWNQYVVGFFDTHLKGIAPTRTPTPEPESTVEPS